MWIEESAGKIAAGRIASGVRVGINYAGEYVHKEWRYWIKDNMYVSR